MEHCQCAPQSLQQARHLTRSWNSPHLLKFPDHYTSTNFVNLNTTHLLSYMEDLGKVGQDSSHQIQPQDEFNSEIVTTPRGIRAVSSFDDDYAYRGAPFSNYCLYETLGINWQADWS